MPRLPSSEDYRGIFNRTQSTSAAPLQSSIPGSARPAKHSSCESAAQCGMCETAHLWADRPVNLKSFYVGMPIARIQPRMREGRRMHIFGKCGDREVAWILLALTALVVFVVNVYAAALP